MSEQETLSGCSIFALVREIAQREEDARLGGYSTVERGYRQGHLALEFMVRSEYRELVAQGHEEARRLYRLAKGLPAGRTVRGITL